MQATHWPFMSGRYGVGAGLSRLGEQKAFDLNSDRARYVAVKARNLASDPEAYYAVSGFSAELERAVAEAMAYRLAREWPEAFSLASGKLVGPEGRVCLGARGAFDGICRQIQEDAAVVVRRPDGGDHNAAIHLCLPNHWSARDKVGRGFVETHAPVAGIAPVSARAAEFVRIMVNATDGLVRFAWGVATDDRLDHPPAAHGRDFDPDHPAAWVRVERQVILGLPDASCAIFLIRTYLYHVERDLDTRARAALAEAVEGMSDDSSIYKGLTAWRGGLLRWVRSLG